MGENKKYIRFFSWITALFLVLTYVFSIAKISSSFMSSDFLEIIFGGLFASFGVMLLAEIKKYTMNKQIAEDNLYDSLVSLYAELVVQSKQTEVYLNNQNAAVPENLFSNRASAIAGYVYSLRKIDYSPKRESAFSKQWNEYRNSELRALDKFVGSSYIYLTLAINQEKLRALEQKITTYHPTGKDHDVNITLRKMKANIDERTHAIEQVLDLFSSNCKKTYGWEEEKKKYQGIEIGLPIDSPELKAFFEE